MLACIAYSVIRQKGSVTACGSTCQAKLVQIAEVTATGNRVDQEKQLEPAALCLRACIYNHTAAIALAHLTGWSLGHVGFAGVVHGAGGILVHAQAQLVWAAVMTDDIQVLLSKPLQG